jgi:hypothetical protein
LLVESGDDDIPREDWVMLIAIHGGSELSENTSEK